MTLDRPAPPADALLRVEGLVKQYRLPRERLLAPAPRVQALRGVDFALQAGRSLGIVGESGSGKSTLARLVMALETPTAGRIWFDGQDLNALAPAALRAARAGFQMVFQDPFGSLDPRLPVSRIVAEPLRAQGRLAPAEQRDRVIEQLEAVGLGPQDAEKYPHEFSGGQRQRIAIARALVTQPRLIVADEPVSALDVSVQAQVLNLMQDLQDRLGVTYLFISHDLAVVDLVCDEVLVLYQGRVVEQGSPDALFTQAAHPYTRALIEAVPKAREGAGAAAGASPAAPAAPARRAGGAASPAPAAGKADATGPAADATPRRTDEGCAFAPRCAWREARCLQERPLLQPVPLRIGRGAVLPLHQAACHRAAEIGQASAGTAP